MKNEANTNFLRRTTILTRHDRGIVAVIALVAFASIACTTARSSDVGVPGAPVPNATSASTPRGAVIAIPAYTLLGNESIQDEVGLSKSQREKLGRIARSCEDAQSAIREELSKLGATQDIEKFSKQKQDEVRALCRAQIEAVLTPSQLAALKKLILLKAGGVMLDAQKTISILHLTDAQRQACASVEGRYSDLVRALTQSESAKLLAVLTPEQSRTARRDVLTSYHLSREAQSQAAVQQGGNVIVRNYAGISKMNAPAGEPSKSEAIRISLPVYETLDSPETRRKLGVTPAQESKIREISARFVAQENEAINGATDQVEFARKCDTIAMNVRSKIESVLTSEQQALLNDLVFHANVMTAFSTHSIVENLHLTTEQRTKLTAIHVEASDAMRQNLRKKEEAKIGQLTAAQLKLLQQQLDDAGF